MTFNSIEFGSFFFIVISLCAVWPQARTSISTSGEFYILLVDQLDVWLDIHLRHLDPRLFRPPFCSLN